MARSEWLTLAGSVLTFVLGLPAVVWLLASGSEAVAVFVLLIVLLLMVVLGGLFWFVRLPNWTILQEACRVTVEDPGGKSATIRKTLKLRPNRPGLSHYTHLNLSADGRLAFNVDPGVELVNTSSLAGDSTVTVQFPHQRRLWKPVETWLEIECSDSFTGREEGFVVEVDQPTKELIVEIILPETSQFWGPRVLYHHSGMQREIGIPDTIENAIKWSRRRRLGLRFGDYEIGWTWRPSGESGSTAD